MTGTSPGLKLRATDPTEEEVEMAGSVEGMIEECRRLIESLSVEEAAAELEAGLALLVDVREDSEVEEHGLIPGAIRASRGMLEFWADPLSPNHRPEFDPGRRMILYCDWGGRSALAVAALQRLGYTDIGHLEGGLQAWIAAGRETVAA